jgi:hypothetical protein
MFSFSIVDLWKSKERKIEKSRNHTSPRDPRMQDPASENWEQTSVQRTVSATSAPLCSMKFLEFSEVRRSMQQSIPDINSRFTLTWKPCTKLGSVLQRVVITILCIFQLQILANLKLAQFSLPFLT